MAVVLGIKQAYKEVRLDDSPDSPVFVIDFTDAGLTKNVTKFRSLLGEMKMVQTELGELGESDKIPAHLKKAIAAAYRKIITEVLGKEAYQEIVGYVGCGKVSAVEISTLLSPLVTYLCNEIREVIDVRQIDAMQKYAPVISAVGDADAEAGE